MHKQVWDSSKGSPLSTLRLGNSLETAGRRLTEAWGPLQGSVAALDWALANVVHPGAGTCGSCARCELRMFRL